MTLSESVMTKSGKEPDYQFALLLIHQSLKHGPRAEDGYGQVILARATYHAGDKVEGRKIAARARKLVQDDKQMPDGFKQQCLDQLSTLE